MSNGKSANEKEKENNHQGRNNIKSAADLLLKGGTLLSSSCAKCGGVQVRYKEETVCVSCGRKIKEMSNGLQQMEEEQQQQQQQQQQHSIQDSHLPKESKVTTVFDSGITNTPYNTKIIIEKINFLITTLENDNDILIQDTKLDLILKYLEILDKLKIISSNSSSSNSNNSSSNSKET
ncbi:MAG: Sjogren's syndrome/scleroderma autoantigen 1 family protein [Nitrososphaeraceae archaeon]